MDRQTGRNREAGVSIFATFRCERANLENMLRTCDTFLKWQAPAVDLTITYLYLPWLSRVKNTMISWMNGRHTVLQVHYYLPQISRRSPLEGACRLQRLPLQFFPKSKIRCFLLSFVCMWCKMRYYTITLQVVVRLPHIGI